MTQTKTTPGLSARTAFVAGLLAALLVSLFDALVGLGLPGPEMGFGEVTGYFFAVLGPGVVTGVLLGGATAMAAVLNGVGGVRILGRRMGYGTILAALAVIAFLEWANLTLFEGGNISGKWYRPIAEWIVRLAIPVAVFVMARLATPHLSAAIEGQPGGSRRVLGALLIVVSAALCYANANLYRGLYEYIHRQEVVVALIAAQAGICLLCARTRLDGARTARRTLVVTGLAAAVFIGAIVMRGAESYTRTRATAINRARALTFHGGWGNDLLDWIRPPKRIELIDVTDLVGQLRGATSAELLETLDRALPDRRDFNILWIAIDTLRADHCGFNGYQGGVTPRLDELAKDAFVFTRAHAPYPTSNYSYSATVTSLYPRTTPVYNYTRKLGRTFPKTATLPGLLSANGWYTAAATAFGEKAVKNDAWFGTFKLGFESFNPDQTPGPASVEEVADSVRGTLRALTGQKYFMWLHCMDPHAPYLKHDGFDRGDSERERYDGEIAYSDWHIGRLLDDLEREGRLDKTVVVVFSDHGEAFGEHGVSYHNSSVYQTQVHVPLLIRIPGVKGRKVDTAVNLVDLLPTLTQLLDVKDEHKRFGRSLLPFMFSDDAEAPGFSYSEVFGLLNGRHARDQRALIHDHHKIVYRPYQESWEIYDLEADPGELNSLVGTDEALEQKLYSMIKAVDREIDTYGGFVADDDDARRKYIAGVDALIARVVRGDRDARAAVTELHRRFMSPDGQLFPDATKHLGPDGIQDVFDRLMAAYPTRSHGVNGSLIRFLGSLRSPDYVPFFKKHMEKEKKGFQRSLLAWALALAGDDSGRAYLKEFPGQETATALAYLGDPDALAWLRANLWEESWRVACHAMRCLPRYPDLDGARFVRGRFVGYARYEVKMALLDGIESSSSPDATLLLLRLATTRESDIRARALEILRKRMDKDDLERNLTAMGLENAGEKARASGAYLITISNYLRALEAGSLYNSYLRLRLARCQLIAGRTDEARRTLEDVAANSDVAADRQLARTRMREIGTSHRVSPKALKVSVDPTRIRIHNRLEGGRAFLVDVPIKNLSGQPWWGGQWTAGPQLELRLEDAQGNLLPIPRTGTNWLPEEGIGAGEERVLTLRGLAPRKKVSGGRFVLIFKQSYTEYDDGGVIYRHPNPIDL